MCSLVIYCAYLCLWYTLYSREMSFLINFFNCPCFSHTGYAIINTRGAPAPESAPSVVQKEYIRTIPRTREETNENDLYRTQSDPERQLY